ncbi:MAG: transposase [Halobacteriota archaeon]
MVGGRKGAIVQETYVPGMSVSLVARQHGIAPNQVFTWRRPQPEAELVAEIKVLIASQPTYGHRCIHALLRRQRREQGGAAVNVKRVYRVSWVATTGGIDSSDIRNLMIESVERRFGLVNKLPMTIEWLSDNGSPYTAAETRAPRGRYRFGTVHDADPEPSVELHGQSLREDLQAGLRAGQREAQRGQRAAPARSLV